MRITSILFLLFSNFVYGQSDSWKSDIIGANQLTEGVYKNFYEFRTNSPSILGNFTLVEPANSAQAEFGFRKNYLFLTDSTGKKTKIDKYIWGYCNGKDVYIFWDKNYTNNRYFAKLLTIDRYCYFNESGYSTQGSQYQNDYVLNINNGKTYKLSNKVMKEILSRDSVLLKQYIAVGNKRNRREEFIKRYCKRNPNQLNESSQ